MSCQKIFFLFVIFILFSGQSLFAQEMSLIRQPVDTQNTDEVRIGYFHGGRVNMIYRTHINNYFDQEGIKVKLYTRDLRGVDLIEVPKTQHEFKKISKKSLNLGKMRGTEIIDLMGEGKIDAGTVGESSFLQKIHEGAPIVAVALLGYDGLPGKAILLRKDLQINSVKELKGKTIVSRRAGPGDSIFLREFLEASGLSTKDVKVIDQVDEIDVREWLKEGKIDGGLYHLAALRGMVKRGDAYIYRPMDWMNSAISHALLVFNKSYVEKYPERVQKVVNAYVKRVEYEKNIPEDLKDESWDKGLMMKGEFQGLQIPRYDFPPYIRKDLLDELQDLFIKYGYVKNKINLDEYMDLTFVKKAVGQDELISLKDFSLIKDYSEDKNNTVKIYKNKDLEVVRIKTISNLTESSAEELIHTSILTMQSLYDVTAASYPGMVSNEIICDEKFIPQKNNSKVGPLNVSYFFAYLSDRFTYGACTDDLTPYKGVIAWAFCPEKQQLRQYEFISPKEKFQNTSIEFVKQNICQGY